MNTRSKTILVVDDDEKHLLTTRGILEISGYRVVTHNSPFRTVEVIKAEKPDLVILDVNMPALSGDRLCTLLKGFPSSRELPVLLYSSNDEDSLRRSVLEYGADGYACKGDLTALRGRVRDLITA